MSPAGRSSVRTLPSAISRSNERTWLPKLPWVWWFLPCTSAAMAPPMVTCRVPGSTGTHSPKGSSAFISVSMLTPACSVTVGGSEAASTERILSRRVRSSVAPPEFCAASP